jgi:hypothetical protein
MSSLQASTSPRGKVVMTVASRGYEKSSSNVGVWYSTNLRETYPSHLEDGLNRMKKAMRWQERRIHMKIPNFSEPSRTLLLLLIYLLNGVNIRDLAMVLEYVS